MKLTALSLATLIVLASPSAWAEKKSKAAADDGPSEQETVEFINGLLACEVVREKKEDFGFREAIFDDYQTSSVKVDGKELFLTERTEEWILANQDGKIYEINRHLDRINETPVDLSKLDLDVTPLETNVKLNCNPSAGACFNYKIKKFSQDGSTIKNEEEKSTTHYWLNFCDADKAQRAARAMKHLIEISGGKKSLF